MIAIIAVKAFKCDGMQARIAIRKPHLSCDIFGEVSPCAVSHDRGKI